MQVIGSFMRLKELKIPNHVAQLAVYYAAAEVRIESVVIPLLIYRIMIDRLGLCLLRMIRDDAVRVVHP